MAKAKRPYYDEYYNNWTTNTYTSTNTSTGYLTEVDYVRMKREAFNAEMMRSRYQAEIMRAGPKPEQSPISPTRTPRGASPGHFGSSQPEATKESAREWLDRRVRDVCFVGREQLV
jgi:hypothetical protein